MSFGIALSGLDAAQSDLNVTANNIANSQTTGFKSSNANFSELFASSSSATDTQVGNGVQLQDVEQQFTQGDVQTTGNSLDLALSGNGFFTVSQGGSIEYTRAGSFQTNNNGQVVNAAGQFLQVYPPNANGTFNTTSLVNLQVPTGDSPPQASTTSTLDFNLPADATPPAAAFSPTNANSYNQSTSETLYDSLGAAHTASFYFVNTGANTWNAYEYIDGNPVPPIVAPATTPTPVALTYSQTGQLKTVDDVNG